MTIATILPDASSPLEHETAYAAFADMLDGKAADEDVARFLTVMAERDETSIEIAAAAQALRERMIPVAAPAGAIDVCGTGGDGAHSLNISTAVAIVVAACGVAVAKHGNRAASSKAGAADTLEALGLDLDRASARAEESLAALGITRADGTPLPSANGHAFPISGKLDHYKEWAGTAAVWDGKVTVIR